MSLKVMTVSRMALSITPLSRKELGRMTLERLSAE
jgi:hypothetical protein